MKGLSVLAPAFAAVGLFASWATAADSKSIDPLIIKGKHFFWQTNHTEFFIRGVAYQQNYNGNGTNNANYKDPLATLADCQRDIPYLSEIRTNVIRVYAVDPTVDHKPCMDAFAEAGIYILADLSAPSESINQLAPSWTTPLYLHYISLIDNLAQYNNVLGFFAGNEVINNIPTTNSSSFVKAAVRDSKAYIKAQGYRDIGVGYASYDGAIRLLIADYFECGASSAAIDFFGYNVYSWCGYVNYVTSGYKTRTEEFRDYPVPAFFAEYGCNQGDFTVRPFTEVPVLFGPKMAPTWAGGVVYQYFQTVANYGLVSLDGNTVKKLPDFDTYSSQIAKVNPSSTAYDDIPTNWPTPTCPGVGVSWSATATPLPPPANEQVCDCLMDTLGCVVKDGVSSKDYSSLFGYVCGLKGGKYCSGIATKPETGVYGAYSMCEPKVQLSYVLNQYYLAEGSASDACSFKGMATTQSSKQGSGTCQMLLSQAGKTGQGTVPEPHGNSVQQGASSASSSTGAASAVNIPSFDLSILFVNLYVVGAIVAGTGLFFL